MKIMSSGGTVLHFNKKPPFANYSETLWNPDFVVIRI